MLFVLGEQSPSQTHHCSSQFMWRIMMSESNSVRGAPTSAETCADQTPRLNREKKRSAHRIIITIHEKGKSKKQQRPERIFAAKAC